MVINSIAPQKDVDGFHISNVGMLGTGQKSMVPCTPLGCLMMLRDYHGSLSGLDAVVIGRSNIVGKPMAQLLLGDSCTVTIAHSRTKDLKDVVKRPAHAPKESGQGRPPAANAVKKRRRKKKKKGTTPVKSETKVGFRGIEDEEESTGEAPKVSEDLLENGKKEIINDDLKKQVIKVHQKLLGINIDD